MGWSMSERFYVDGLRAHDINEYEAFLRDKKKIDGIVAKADLNNPASLEKVYATIVSGGIEFESKLGFDFEDDIDRRFKVIQQNTRSKSRRRGTSDEPVKSKGNVSREELSDEMKVLVEQEISKSNRRRRIILLSSGIVAAAFIIYFSIYLVYYRQNETLNERLASEVNEVYTSDYSKLPDKHDINAGIATILDPENPPDILEEYKDLYNRNQNLIGWVNIADTNINYPVMQCTDNSYYLENNFDGKHDKNGSIFIDCNCSVFPRCTNLILYGHHMKSGKMFADLEKYNSEAFYKKHSIISFDSIYERGRYAVMYVFRDSVKAQDDVSFKYYEFYDCNSEEEFDSYMNDMASVSLYDTGIKAHYGDQLITLSTCDYQQKNGRFVVVAKRIYE